MKDAPFICRPTANLRFGWICNIFPPVANRLIARLQSDQWRRLWKIAPNVGRITWRCLFVGGHPRDDETSNVSGKFGKIRAKTFRNP